MKELNKEELILIEGGCFAFDAGWFLGNLVTGGFTPVGIASSSMEYVVHYASEHDHN